jgi:hypothetical protein
LELIQDYDLKIDYHSRMVNVVIDALSRCPNVKISATINWGREILKELEHKRIEIIFDKGEVARLSIKPNMLQDISKE